MGFAFFKNSLDVTEVVFPARKLIKPLSYQILELCRRNSPYQGGNDHIIDAQIIAELAKSEDNYAARICVCLLTKLVEEEGLDDDILSTLNLLVTIISISPAVANNLCLNGLCSVIRNIYYNSNFIVSPQTFAATSALVLGFLQTVQPEALTDEEAWLAVTVKLIDCSVTTMKGKSWSVEGLQLVAIFCLILHQSRGKVLFGASKAIIFDAALTSIINNVVHEVCSMGPALSDYNEATSIGETLIFVLLLYYFSLNSLQAILPCHVDLQMLLNPSCKKQTTPMISICCDDLCRIMYFGCPLVKLVASHCLMESLKLLSEHKRNPETDINCPTRVISSMEAILEGMVYCSDIRVSVNSSMSLSILSELGAKKRANMWCRLIVEETAMALAAPYLGSKSLTSVDLVVALLKLPDAPQWMKTVFDDSCIWEIIKNLAASNISCEMICLFRHLASSGLLTDEQIAALNRLLQELRNHVYAKDVQHDERETDCTGDVCEYLIHLMLSETDAKKRLLEEMRLFFRAVKAGEDN